MPLELAISYVASGESTIEDLLEDTFNPYGDNPPLEENDPEAIALAMKRDEVQHALAELQSDLEEVPGWETAEYNDRADKDYYFLGLNNQGKGVFAVVDANFSNPYRAADSLDTDEDIPF